MRHRTLWSALALAAAVATPAAAQLDASRPGVLTGVELRTVSFDSGLGTKTLSEFVVPIGFSLPLGRRLTMDAGTYFVSAKRDDDQGNRATLSGLTDVVLRGAFQLKPDVAVLTVSVSLPTGKATLDGDQLLVAGAMATDLIPFPVTSFGTGTSVTTGLAFATPMGAWALGLAGSYRYNSAYQPLADDTSGTLLQPGGEMRVRIGADRVVGQGRLSLGLTFSTFSNDEFGAARQSPGSRIIPQASWSFALGRNSLSLYAWDIYRNVDENSTLGAAAKENTLTAGALLSVRAGRRNYFRPQVEYRQSWKGPGGLASAGRLIGLSARYHIAASDRLTIVPGVRFDTGSIPIGTTAGSASLTGFSASLTMRAGW